MCFEEVQSAISAGPGIDLASQYAGPAMQAAPSYATDVWSGLQGAINAPSMGNIGSAAAAGNAGLGGAQGLAPLAQPSSFGNIKQFLGPAAMIGSQLYGAKAQSNMMKDLAGAQTASYNQYLNQLNPPHETKNAQFRDLESQVVKNVPIMQRRLRNELASKGVRGQGLASPTAAGQNQMQDLRNQAYFDVYGKYNVPQTPPPVNYTPSTGNLLGSNIGDIGALMTARKLFQ